MPFEAVSLQSPEAVKPHQSDNLANFRSGSSQNQSNSELSSFSSSTSNLDHILGKGFSIDFGSDHQNGDPQVKPLIGETPIPVGLQKEVNHDSANLDPLTFDHYGSTPAIERNAPNPLGPEDIGDASPHSPRVVNEQPIIERNAPNPLGPEDIGDIPRR